MIQAQKSDRRRRVFSAPEPVKGRSFIHICEQLFKGKFQAIFLGPSAIIVKNEKYSFLCTKYQES